MTFRPSVLPDRDNDILSTFTRSFERGRTMSRQDTLDRRAKLEFDARMEDREQARLDKELDFRLRAAQTPGTEIVDTEDQSMLELQQALQGETPRFPSLSPTLPDLQIPGQQVTDLPGMVPGQTLDISPRTLRDPGRPGQEMIIPEDVLARDTPVIAPDAEIVGRAPGGGFVTVSEVMRRAAEDRDFASDAARRSQAAEAAGAPERARVDARTERELESERTTIRFLISQGMLKRDDGTTVTLEDLEELGPDFDPGAIENIMGRRTSARGSTLDRDDQGLTPAQVEAQRRAAQAARRSFQTQFRSAVTRATSAEQGRVDDANENAFGRFEDDFEPEVVDAAAVEASVLESMRRNASEEELVFLNEMEAQRGGTTPPPVVAPPPPAREPRPAPPDDVSGPLSEQALGMLTTRFPSTTPDATVTDFMQRGGFNQDQIDHFLRVRR